MVIFKCSLTQYNLEILFMDFSEISLDAHKYQEPIFQKSN